MSRFAYSRGPGSQPRLRAGALENALLVAVPYYQIERQDDTRAASSASAQLEQLNPRRLSPIYGAAMADKAKYSLPGLFQGPELTLLVLSP